MPERPIILFPVPERAGRESKTPFLPKTKRPDYVRQFDRLRPTFAVLQSAFEQKNVRLQNSPVGMNPDFALVFEIIGSADDFYTAVKHCEGLEWMFDQECDDFDPDDDFYEVDKTTGEKSDEQLSGKLYCVMSNQQAMNQMLSLWQRHKNGETEVFQRGFTGIRNVFTKIKYIRRWNAQDRIAETFALEYWRENLLFDGDVPIPFEIEIFYRAEAEKRQMAVRTISYEVAQLGGSVNQECVIEAISYHALLVELPRNSIENLVNNYENIGLAQVDDVMFFRPTCQSIFPAEIETETFPTQEEFAVPTEPPLIGLLDGLPLQNHVILQNRVIVDDPDGYATGYESKYRIHGTAMSSLVVYGDLNRNEAPIKSPVYIRPILKPKEVSPDNFQEFVPSDKLFVDVLHRAIIRIAQGEGSNPPVAPTVKVINLSVGDPVRQLTTTMSPVARLLDYLSYKYNLLFIVSAGNHPEILDKVTTTFSTLKATTYEQRSKYFFDVVKDHQRNMKVLSPAESINSLTVGAIYDDLCTTAETDRFIYAVEQGMPSPSSSFGKGYRSMITPDIFYYGGRKFIRGNLHDQAVWVLSNREPGCKVAAPYGTGSSSGQAFSFGTSDAAAQLSHEAAKCYDTLSQIFIEETGAGVPDASKAILLKAMLTHGATWEDVCDKVSVATGESQKQLSKWLGNGIPNIDRVQKCTRERITLIGMGSLKKDKGDLFKLPLPIDFSSQLVKRRLTVTLAYFSPISSDRQLYRSAQLWFNVVDDKGLVPDRKNTEWQTVRKGTLQHEIFMGEKTVVWNDEDLIIKINCKEEAGKIRVAIPYCIFVSFEVAEGLNVDLYSKVVTKIRQRVPIQNL